MCVILLGKACPAETNGRLEISERVSTTIFKPLSYVRTLTKISGCGFEGREVGEFF